MEALCDTLCFLEGFNGALWALQAACSTTFLMFGAYACLRDSFIDARRSIAVGRLGIGGALLLFFSIAALLGGVAELKRPTANNSSHELLEQ